MDENLDHSSHDDDYSNFEEEELLSEQNKDTIKSTLTDKVS